MKTRFIAVLVACLFLTIGAVAGGHGHGRDNDDKDHGHGHHHGPGDYGSPHECEHP